jgi:competence protein ComEA
MASDDRRRTLLPYLAGAVVVVFLAMRALGASGGGDTPAVALDGARAEPAQRTERGQRVWVHVTGAVRRPGLYRLDADARAGEALDAAGGFARRADLSAITLAATVRDGQQIVVPARGQRAAAAASPPGATATAPAGGGPGPAGAAGAKVSLGSATVEQLDALDGIGPTLAQRILQWRDAHGGFKSVEQLREVEGIGEKRFESLRSAVEP